MSEYPKISQDDYDKAKGQARMAIQAYLAAHYCKHGYKEDAAIVAHVIMDIVEQFGMRVRQKEVPIQLPDHIKRMIERGEYDD